MRETVFLVIWSHRPLRAVYDGGAGVVLVRSGLLGAQPWGYGARPCSVSYFRGLPGGRILTRRLSMVAISS
jgi:hypothetical protein